MPSCKDMSERVSRGWREMSTLLAHIGRDAPPEEGSFVNPSLARGSTVLFPTVGAMNGGDNKSHTHRLVYGAMGTPAQHRLERVLATIEGGEDTQITSSGLSACSMALLAFLEQGAHVLLADSVYGPTRRFATTLLARYGVEVEFYPPCIDEAGLKNYFKPNTRLLVAESPGSHSFEVQDVPMLARLAHAYGAKLMLDNTWGMGVFKPFAHGVDISVVALTKYACGHSDVVAGAITTRDRQDWQCVRNTAIQLGETAGPEECWLVLRGLRTLSVRLIQQSRSACEVALWLSRRPEVMRVLHPALPESPGHQFWERDFSGASSLFGVVLRPEFSARMVENMIDSLTLFGIGASWGGYESLVLPANIKRNYPPEAQEGPGFRLHIGVENPEDLIADLAQAFAQMTG